MKTQLIVGLTAAALLSGTALAQTNQPSGNMSGTTAPATQATPGQSTMPPASATTGAASATDMTKGFAMSSTASVPVRYGNADASNLMSSKLIGVDVYNNEKEKIGEIKDLAIDNGKTLAGVIVSVGGFLGMGESYVLIEPSSIALNSQDGEWRAYVDTNKDSLKSAPKFTYKDVGKKS